MRNLILVILLAGAPLACDSGGRAARLEALRQWESRDSSLEQRAEAAQKLVKKGATVYEILAILGPKGRCGHYHGPSFSLLTDGTNVPHQLPDHDYWVVDYEFLGGGVNLHLDARSRFEWVSAYRTLEGQALTNKP